MYFFQIFLYLFIYLFIQLANDIKMKTKHKHVKYQDFFASVINFHYLKN